MVDLLAARPVEMPPATAVVAPVEDETDFTRGRRTQRRMPMLGVAVLALLAGALAFVVASHVLGR